MKISFVESGVIIILTLARVIKCYDVSLSKSYLKMELNNWSNFTLHIESRGYVSAENIIIEVNHTSVIKVSPKIVEIHSKNFSSWCHMFHVYASKPGLTRINFNFGNSTIRNQANDLNIEVDTVRMKVLETYGHWCRNYYYIFSTMSVYPQIILQFVRLGVVGLDMDYVCFNIIGHLTYGVFIILSYTKMDAFNDKNLDQNFPVTFIENMYTLHGFILSIILGIQAVRYFGIDKRVTIVTKEILSIYGIVFTFGFLLAKFRVIQYMDFLHICKYIHVAATTTKYLPQLYKNYMIKSTFGWNIWNSNLESFGCLAIIMNLCITSYNYDNWITIINDYLFWMACIIILQHITFMVQHYFVYKKWSEFVLEEFQDITLHDKLFLYERRLDLY